MASRSDVSQVDKLISTLDLDLLDIMSPYSKKVVDMMASDKKMKHVEFQMLYSNYLKYRNNPIVYPDYLTGPDNLTEMWSDKHKKQIYLFGEYHGDYDDQKISCPVGPFGLLGTSNSHQRASDFVNKVIRTSYKPIDFYLEDTYIASETFLKKTVDELLKKYEIDEAVLKDKEDHMELVRLRKLVEKCISTDRAGCELLTTRSHYVDVRGLHEYPGAISEFFFRHKFPDSAIYDFLSLCFIDRFSLETYVTRLTKYMLKQADQPQTTPEIKEMLLNYIHRLKKCVIPDTPEECLDHPEAYNNNMVMLLRELNWLSQLNYKFLTDEKFEDVRADYPDYVKTNKDYEYFFDNMDSFFKNDKSEKFTYNNLKTLVSMYLTLRTFTPFFDPRLVDNDSIPYSTLFNDFGKVLLQMCNQLSVILPVITEAVDYYTIGRMFRRFKDIPNRNSISPRNIIFYGGDDHTRHIIQMLEEMGFEKKVYNSTKAGGEFEEEAFVPGCIDIRSLKEKGLFWRY